MLNRIVIRIKLIGITLFVVGLVSAAVAYATKQSNGVKLKAAKGFTLVTRETVFPTTIREQGPPEMRYTITTRHEKSDGTWKQVRTFYQADGKVVREDLGFGIPGEGVFQVDQYSGTLNFVSAMGPKEETSNVAITDGRDHPNFLREEVVQGFTTYVLRFPDQEGGYVDTYRAPELNNRTIRRITVSDQGVAVQEPTQITLGNPDDNVFERLPKWHVRFERFQEKIKAMEEIGKPETAAGLRKQMERQLEKPGRNK